MATFPRMMLDPRQTPGAPGILAAAMPQQQGILAGAGQQPGGILSGFQQRMPKVSNWLGDHSGALLAMSLPMLLGYTRRDQIGGLQNMMAGAQMDAARVKDRKEQERLAQQQAALDKLAASVGHPELAGIDASIAGPIIAQIYRAPDVPQPTDDMREFNFAQQNGFKGSFEDWMRVRSPQNNFNVPPTPAQGWQNIYDDQNRLIRQEVIPGGPADVKAQEAAAAQANRQAQRAQTGDLVVQDIDRVLGALAEPSLPKTGPIGSLLSNIPGTAAFDVNRTLDTIRANVGFGQLQAMRDASPTGGALGQVSERENALLQSVLGNLEQSQSYEQFQFNLKRLKNIYLDIVHGPGNGPPRERLDQPGGPADDDPLGILR